MGISDYQLGYQSYFDGMLFDETRTSAWKEGWQAAEDDDYDSYDDSYDYGYGDEDDYA